MFRSDLLSPTSDFLSAGRRAVLSSFTSKDAPRVGTFYDFFDCPGTFRRKTFPSVGIKAKGRKARGEKPSAIPEPLPSVCGKRLSSGSRTSPLRANASRSSLRRCHVVAFGRTVRFPSFLSRLSLRFLFGSVTPGAPLSSSVLTFAFHLRRYALMRRICPPYFSF